MSSAKEGELATIDYDIRALQGFRQASPVTAFTLVLGEAASTSCPTLPRVVTTCEPISPCRR